MKRRYYKETKFGLCHKIKIGRLEFNIHIGDVFGDNVACVQLLTQYYDSREWHIKQTPMLSKKMAKEIHKLFEFEISPWNNSETNKLYKVTDFKSKCFE